MGSDNAVKKRMETLDVKDDLDYVGSEKKVNRTLVANKSTRAGEHEGRRHRTMTQRERTFGRSRSSLLSLLSWNLVYQGLRSTERRRRRSLFGRSLCSRCV